jgi:hypothetical protein
MQLLKERFPDKSEGSLGYQIKRYQCRNDNRMRWDPENGIKEGYASNGKLHAEVWEEQDWRMPATIAASMKSMNPPSSIMDLF